MPGWVWVVIVLAVLVVIALVVWRALLARRTDQLRERFGPEYDRAAESTGGRRQAEAELMARQQHRDSLEIRPLVDEARRRYADQWQTIQGQFVDTPTAAVVAADGLVSAVMSDRGYPTDDFEQRAADVSVDHPEVVESYREARRISDASKQGQTTTEELRQAMRHYRLLFDELLDNRSAAA
jgi:hypothetical protein